MKKICTDPLTRITLAAEVLSKRKDEGRGETLVSETWGLISKPSYEHNYLMKTNTCPIEKLLSLQLLRTGLYYNYLTREQRGNCEGSLENSASTWIKYQFGRIRMCSGFGGILNARACIFIVFTAFYKTMKNIREQENFNTLCTDFVFLFYATKKHDSHNHLCRRRKNPKTKPD